MNKKFIFGITLFSVVQKASKKYVIRDEGYLEKLFSDHRLNIKSEIFFNLSIPQLSLMINGDCVYRHFVIYSKSLPEKYKEKIINSEKKFNFIDAICVDDYSDFNIKELIKNYIKSGDVFALFGLDDDDLLAVNFLKKLQKYVKEEFVGFNVVMSKGYSGFYDGELSNCREIRFPFINIGQARICRRNVDGTIFIPEKGSHMRTDEKCPTIIDSREPNFFWLRHLVQDTFSNSNNQSSFLKIKNDLDAYPEPSKSIFIDFPVLKECIKKDLKRRLNFYEKIFINKYKEEVVVLDDVSLSGEFVVKYKLRNFSECLVRQAIVIFRLSRELTDVEILDSGLQVSKIGYYRYFNTSGEELSGTFSISLPEKVHLVRLSVMKWGRDNIFIDEISIFQ